MTFQIKTLNAISKVGLNRLPEDTYVVGNDLDSPDAILLRSASLHGVEIPGSVLAVARAGAGTNNIPIAEYSALGIPVFNTPGANANAVKELVVAAIFLAARNIIPAASFAHRLDGDAASMDKAVEAGKKQFVGFELPGRTLGVVGLGAIGVEVANAAVGLGMKVMGFDPAITVEHAWNLSSKVERVTNLDAMLKRADIVTVHVPLVDATKGLIGAAQLGVMRKSAVLVNFARGPIVDGAAVVEALESGSLRGYVCDFPTPELNKRPNVVTLPHLGASTNEAEENCAYMAAEELKAYLEDGTIKNSVNFPEAELARVAGTQRLAIANSNVPNMVGQISTLLADAGLNISDLLNKSRGELAYTLVDVDGEVPASLVPKIKSIHGVLSARVI
ncbi:phosphoglycerate dehydrogenase [Propionicimonas sp.]|uniref:phosphoglycerate dehydrogenase n=1 Tax=Propionicimonas sp. TaxID=1955623 RepID=UPI0017E22403|nr:phosphoglycerate dehydrogenase [Propionicimonas sp.]MBU3977429.1 phosphoglycerate dehydrogenase [Actinomycetota bacterium]MBA3021353.1 3-phosphoglycerate dehydrogenase [Propionicimonas sp.]MBU3985939.1 phosphoglycerate dehydrogenase [Actinomycetota bacterium]MBU4008724.1 phosphoglycerate dehydrogenase [Actinomycetota bacterium]MBU4066126.1 phosphoglycerate dehydrogenase [Actinomycetota bacterium]